MVSIKGVLACADSPTISGKKFSRALLQKIADGYQEKIQEQRSLEFPIDPLNLSTTINLQKVGILITKLYMDGDCLLYEGHTLETPMGKVYESMFNQGISFTMGIAGVGMMNPDMTVNEEGYEFLGLHIIGPNGQQLNVELP